MNLTDENVQQKLSTQTYQLKCKLVLRSIAGETIAVPVGENAGRLHGMISLTSSGGVLLERLQQECSYEELVQAILDKYEVEKEQAEDDINRFLCKLKELDLI